MKRVFPIVLAGLLLLFNGCHNDLWDSINDLQSRVEKLEVLCAKMNTNIDALQTIVNALQTNDMITNVAEVKEGNAVIGYSITFLSGKTITIHNGKDGVDGQDGKDGVDGQDGQDGKDGKDGKDGQDGYTPQIGVDQDTDGIYYWTLDGEWLLGTDGNKLPVTGAPGEKGEKGDQGEKGDKGEKGEPGAQGEKGDAGTDGEDGEKGDTGADGDDGITPQLKIDGGYWYISYDNGANWTQLGKATGEKGDKGDTGATGAKGDKGDKGDTGNVGDSIFRSVTSDDNYVYFTLRTGKVFRVPTGNASTSSRFAIVYNLNEGLGTFATDSFSYSQATTLRKCTYLRARYAFAGWNTKSNGSGSNYEAGATFTVTQNITLYARWVLTEDFSVGGGKRVKFAPGNLQYQARTKTWRFAENQYDYIGEGNNNITAVTYAGWIDLFGWGTANNPTNTSTTNSDYSFTDWGINKIDDYAANTWRTLTIDEWQHLYDYRNNAASRRGSATVEGIYGVVFLPDSWQQPSGVSFTADTKDYASNKYTLEQWSKMEAAGAVFLPAAGLREGSTFFMNEWYGCYWASTTYDTDVATYAKYFRFSKLRFIFDDIFRYYGCSVRLVHDS